MSSSPRARRARSLLLCVLSALLARSQKVAVVTSSNCVSVDPSAPHDVGTQFAASLVILMRMKALFPSWTPLVLTNRRDWDKRRGGTSGGLASCDALLTRAQERFRMLHDSELSVLSIDPLTDPLLTRLAHSTGREADHSRGHWPVEAYFPLVAGERLGAMGYSHTVAVDPDAWPLDSRLAAEVGAVRGIACVRAAPAACVGLDPGVHSPESPKAQRALNEEYRLLADPALRARATAAAGRAGHGLIAAPLGRDLTNSGVVVYNNTRLRELSWNAWLLALYDASDGRGLYSDQTALSVALQRDDLDIHWLHPRYNVALSAPSHYVRTTCGADARYAVHAADGLAGGALSIVHFVWGPKPWTAAMGAKGTLPRRRSHQPMTIQADTRFVNDYRNFAVAALGETLALAAFGPLPRLNESALAAHVHVSQADFEYCARRWPKGGCDGG